MLARLELAGPGDQRERQIIAESGGANSDVMVRIHGRGL
jgi:hypothetical protein